VQLNWSHNKGEEVGVVVHTFQEGVVEVGHSYLAVEEGVVGQPSLVVEEAVVDHSCQEEAEATHRCLEEVEVAE